MNPLCLVKGLRHHPDMDNSNLKIYKITGFEDTSGLAYACGHHGGPFEFTISAPSVRDVQVYIDIHNMEEASTYSDCHSYLDSDFDEVTGVTSDHHSWSDITTPCEYLYNSFLENYKDTYQELFGETPPNIP